MEINLASQSYWLLEFRKAMENTALEIPLSRHTIRVLDVLPAKAWDDPIDVKTRVIPISNHGSYEALSYVWGDQVNMTTVQVDD